MVTRIKLGFLNLLAAANRCKSSSLIDRDQSLAPSAHNSGVQVSFFSRRFWQRSPDTRHAQIQHSAPPTRMSRFHLVPEQEFEKSDRSRRGCGMCATASHHPGSTDYL